MMRTNQRKPVYEKGINDADYPISRLVEGKQVRCPYYRKWQNMLKRCYSDVSYPTYKGCTVSDEWLRFSSFKSWMSQQDWEDMELDKDLIQPGNKIYSEEKCLFIPHQINSLLNDSKKTRGKYPQGVTRIGERFQARCSINGKVVYLGLYDTVEGASRAYINFKVDSIWKVAAEHQQNSKLYNALMRQADLIGAMT